MIAHLSLDECLLSIQQLESDKKELLAATEQTTQELNRYRLMLDNASDLIHSVTPEGKFLYTNQAWRDTLGYSDEEITRLSLLEIIAPDFQNLAVLTFNSLLNGEQIDRRTTSFISKSGTIILVEGRCAVHSENGKPVFVTGIFRDITAQTDREQALIASEHKYKTLFENASNLIQMVNPDGKILYVNQAWRDTFGYSQEEVANLSIFDVICTDCKEHCQTVFQQVLSDPQLHHIATSFSAKDGRKILIEGTAICTYEQGRPLFTQCIFNDITEKTRLQEELTKAQRLESLGYLAGGIAHDFNNLLTAVLGNLSLARIYAEPGSLLADYLDKTEKAAFRGKGLTKQLLTFAKGGEPVKKNLSIAELLVDATSFILKGSKSHCTYSFTNDLWQVEGDEGQLSQVAQNLVINASQAMPNGGTISISAVNQRLREGEIPTLPAGRFVKIVFHDQGCGIPPEHLPQIFDPYFSSKNDGTGLGLAISYSIISKHGGAIQVASEKGQGTTFTIFLPASAPKPNPHDNQDKKTPTITSQIELKILIMDDDRTVRDIITAMLTALHCQVEESTNGHEAITAFTRAREANSPFDCVLMDLVIPDGMGGKETIAAMLALDPSVKVIAVSGYASDPIMANHRAFGFSGILPKPFSFDELQQVLAQVCGPNPKK